MSTDPIEPGASRDPRYFVGRQRATREAHDWIRSGRDIALTDPRRLGKTYWLRFLAATTSEFDVVVVDYEGVTTAEEFLLRTAAALRDFQGLSQNARDRLRGMFSGFELSAGPVTLSAAVKSQSPYKLLADTVGAVEDHAERIVVLAMDEVPIAIQSIVRSESPESAGEVLMVLRSLRQRTKRVRWIVAGSVGFHHVLRMARVTEGALNDLEVLTLGPLTDLEASELSSRLFAGIGRASGVETVETLTATASGIPFIMHRIVTILQSTNSSGEVTSTEVVAAFEAFVADRDGSRSVTHLVTRLDDLYGDRVLLAQKVLNHLATENREVELADLCALAECDVDQLRPVLDDLLDDHYLERRTGTTFVWRYDVLRRIWIERMYLQ